MAVTIKNNPLKNSLKRTSGYGWRESTSSMHKGTDFSGQSGTAIYAVDDGTVHLIKNDPKGYGNYIILKHEGYYTLYAHLRNSASGYVSVGEYVRAGRQIGEMGNSGGVIPKPTASNPTAGTHLHFEIRLGEGDFWSAKPADPMVYLGSADLKDATYYSAEPRNASLNATEASYSEYTNETSQGIYPETIANTTTQPAMAFVEVYVGDTKLTLLPPNYLQAFEFQKIADDRASNFVLTIFDDSWDDVEYLFSKNQQDIKFRYGFVNGKQSKMYTAHVDTYTIDFSPTGTILNIKGMTTGAITNLKNMTYNTGTKNPTEAAKAIAREVGWQVYDANFHPSLDIDFDDRDSITMKNERPATYIINKLAPLAIRSSDGKGGYRFYLDESEDPPVAYFRPIDLHADAKRTYIYMKGVDSPVLDLQLSINGVFGGSAEAEYVATSLVSNFVDATTKEEISVSKNIEDTRVETTGVFTHTNSSQYTATVDAGGSSRAEMDARLNYKLSFKSAVGAVTYTGYMTIIGDPTIESIQADDDDTIRVLIVTDRGDLHHSSGIYAITGITDSIQGGILRTTLKIEKRENIQDGIQILNYREVLE